MFDITFSYNLNKDLNNYLNAIYKFRYLKHGRKNIEKTVSKYLSEQELTKIKTSKNKKAATLEIQKILLKWLAKNQDLINLNQQSLTESWNKRQDKFITFSEKFFEKKFNVLPVTAYFTTLPICPYYYPAWFMVSIKEGLEGQLHTIYHELFHFMFIKYYGNYCKNKHLTQLEFESIKEALTVFLMTPPFTKINTLSEQGYPQEQELRNFMLKSYRKNHKFISLLNTSIKWIKNHQEFISNI